MQIANTLCTQTNKVSDKVVNLSEKKGIQRKLLLPDREAPSEHVQRMGLGNPTQIDITQLINLCIILYLRS